MIKCSYRFNPFRTRATLIHYYTIEHECSRHRKDETLEYAVKYSKIEILRIEFEKNLIKCLEKVRSNDVNSDKMLLIVDDILLYFDIKEDKECELN